MIAVGFVLLSALLLWLLIFARGNWALKLALIVVVPAFGFAVWGSLDGYKGWPSGNSPPAHAQFLWGAIDEPDPLTHTRGEIDLWLVPPDPQHSAIGYDSRAGEPRVYRLPYSRSLHEQVLAAQKMVARGQPVQYDRKGQPPPKSKGKAGTVGRSSLRRHFYKLPPPVVQQKARGGP